MSVAEIIRRAIQIDERKGKITFDESNVTAENSTPKTLNAFSTL